jgi:hypothetical protein
VRFLHQNFKNETRQANMGEHRQHEKRNKSIPLLQNPHVLQKKDPWQNCAITLQPVCKFADSAD